MLHHRCLIGPTIPLDPLTTNVPHHIETGQCIYNANQSTSFYMMGSISRQWVNRE